MKKTAVLILILAASAEARAVRVFTDPGTGLTRTAPSGSTEGANLSYASGWRVEICAPVNCVITGGSFEARILGPSVSGASGLWARNPTVTASGISSGAARCWAIEGRPEVAEGRLVPVWSDLTLSGSGACSTVIVRTYVLCDNGSASCPG